MPWQEEHGYPLMFATEASIDLAEDAELMQLMVDANISNVFVGIESPNEQSVPTIRHNPRHCVCREMGRRSLSEHLGFGLGRYHDRFLYSLRSQPTYVSSTPWGSACRFLAPIEHRTRFPFRTEV